jgi:hypothetical protein
MSYCITRGANIGITTLSDVRKKISRISIPSGVASQSSEQRAFFGLGNLFHFFFDETGGEGATDIFVRNKGNKITVQRDKIKRESRKTMLKLISMIEGQGPALFSPMDSHD